MNRLLTTRSPYSGLLLPLLILLPAAACGEPGGEVDFGGEDLGEVRFAVASEDGGVTMALTDDFVYFALSDSLVDVVRTELQDSTPEEGIGGAISRFVRGGVERAMQFRTRYAVDEIRDIRWEDGRMVFDFDDPDRTLGKGLRVDDRPVEEAFTQDDVRVFAEAFHELKRERPGG